MFAAEMSHHPILNNDIVSRLKPGMEKFKHRRSLYVHMAAVLHDQPRPRALLEQLRRQTGREISGVAGGRRAFHYYADTVDQVLYLEDKYRVPEYGPRGKRNKKHQDNQETPHKSWISPAAQAHIGNEVSMIDPRAASARRDKEYAEAPKFDKRAHMTLHYETTDGSHIILRGIDEHKDSLYIVLDRNPKPYALSESSLQAGKY